MDCGLEQLINDHLNVGDCIGDAQWCRITWMIDSLVLPYMCVLQFFIDSLEEIIAFEAEDHKMEQSQNPMPILANITRK